MEPEGAVLLTFLHAIQLLAFIFFCILGYDVGTGSSHSNVKQELHGKEEVDVFSNPDNWMQENAQKRKRSSGV